MKLSILAGIKGGKDSVILAGSPPDVRVKFKELQRDNGGGYDELLIFGQSSRKQKFKSKAAAPKPKKVKADK